MNITKEMIALFAKQKWLLAGKPKGKDLDFWLEAEKELLWLQQKEKEEEDARKNPPLHTSWRYLDL